MANFKLEGSDNLNWPYQIRITDQNIANGMRNVLKKHWQECKGYGIGFFYVNVNGKDKNGLNDAWLQKWCDLAYFAFNYCTLFYTAGSNIFIHVVGPDNKTVFINMLHRNRDQFIFSC